MRIKKTGIHPDADAPRTDTCVLPGVPGALGLPKANAGAQPPSNTDETPKYHIQDERHSDNRFELLLAAVYRIRMLAQSISLTPVRIRIPRVVFLVHCSMSIR
jgi:hypothetical protein